MCSDNKIQYKVTTTATLSGSPNDYASHKDALRTGIATKEKVDKSKVTISFTAGSTIMTVIILFNNQGDANNFASSASSMTTASAVASYAPIAAIPAIANAVSSGATVTTIIVVGSSGGLTDGQLAGIIVGSVVGFCCIVAIIMLVMKSQMKTAVVSTTA